MEHALIAVTVAGEPAPYPDLPCVTLDLARFHGGAWAAQLDAAFAKRPAPAVVVAKGLAGLAVAWWAQLSPASYTRQVAGALFVSPLYVPMGLQSAAAALRQGPLTRLPFPSLVVAASHASPDYLLALADGWGSLLIDTDAPGGDAPTNRAAPTSGDAQWLVALHARLSGTARAAPNLTLASEGPLPLR